MREYETMCVLKPAVTEAAVGEIQEKLLKLVKENKGAVFSLRSLGKKPLAFPVEKELEGVYLQWNYGGGGPLVSEIEKILKYDERVLRFLTVVLKKEVDAVKRLEEVKQAEGA